jgi:hypothetical protein
LLGAGRNRPAVHHVVVNADLVVILTVGSVALVPALLGPDCGVQAKVQGIPLLPRAVDTGPLGCVCTDSQRILIDTVLSVVTGDKTSPRAPAASRLAPSLAGVQRWTAAVLSRPAVRRFPPEATCASSPTPLLNSDAGWCLRSSPDPLSGVGTFRGSAAQGCLSQGSLSTGSPGHHSSVH